MRGEGGRATPGLSISLPLPSQLDAMQKMESEPLPLCLHLCPLSSLMQLEQEEKKVRQKMKLEAHMYYTIKLATDQDMVAQVCVWGGGGRPRA